MCLAGIIEVFFAQPIFSSYSDQCTLKMGRRRPFIIGSVALCVVGMLCVAFADKIGKMIGGSKGEKGATTGVFIVFIMLWYIGAAIFGGPMRALVSDCCPDSQQVWISNIYNIVGTFTGILTSLLGTFEVYKYIGFHDNETFLLVFGIVVGFLALLITCFATPEEPLLEKPADAKNPIVELVRTLKTIPKPALIADVYYAAVSLMNYEKGCWESAFYAQYLYGGTNTTYDSPEKDKYQAGLSFFFTVTLAANICCFVYNWANTWVVEKLGYKIISLIAVSLFTGGIVLAMFVKNKYICLVIWILCIYVPSVITGTVPGAIVSLSVSSSTLGSQLAILNSFCVAGQILANVIVGMGLGNLWNFEPKYMIGSGVVGGAIAIVLSLFIIVPSRDVGDFEDEDNDDQSSESDHPNSL